MSVFFIFILGLAIGSFLNVLADRLSNEQGIGGRSRCDHCKKTLKGTDLIPVVSWLMLGGRCRYCKKKLSVYYPIVELVTGFSFVFILLNPVISIRQLPERNLIEIPQSFLSFGIISSLIVIFFADLKFHIIPDEMIAAMVIFTIPLVLIENILMQSIIGGAVVWGIIYGLYLLTQGRGMGFGDVKFAVAMGFLLGWRGGLVGLYIAFILGAIASVILILKGKKGLKSKIAFGPFLVIGTVIAWFYQDQMLTLFKTIFNL